MKTSKEILDQFGEILISNVFDQNLKMMNNDIQTFANKEGYKNLL
ncbi:hypothetical protein [Aquimarina algiphila]|nr:hypothetical protein [Aquimarina algiphila]